MGSLSVDFPIHQYTGTGLGCSHAVAGKRCNKNKKHAIHGVEGGTVPKSQLNYTAEEDMMVHVYQPGPDLLVHNDKCTYLGVDGKRCYRPEDNTWHRTAARPHPEHYDTHAGRITLDNPPSTMQGLMVFFDQCAELAGRKDAAYGGAWRRQGYMGNLARLMSKADRLRNILWSSSASYGTEEHETVQDTLKDMANLAGFMHRNYEDGNQWGQ